MFNAVTFIIKILGVKLKMSMYVPGRRKINFGKWKNIYYF